MIDSKKKILLSLYYSKEKSLNRTTLMKLIYIIDEIFKIDTDDSEFNFKELHYGPWSANFETIITPLVIGDLVHYEEHGNQKSYSFSEKKKEKLFSALQTIISTSDNHDAIKLIEFLANKYPPSKLDDLIQFVYFIKPDSAKKSEIRERIEKYKSPYNRRVIIQLLLSFPLKFINILLKEPINLLRFFISDDEISFMDELVLILDLIRNSFNDSVQFINVKKLVEITNRIKRNDKSEDFREFYYGLFSIIMNLDEKSWNKDLLISILMYIFESLSFSWPLSNDSFENFNNILSLFKKRSGITSFLVPTQPELQGEAIIDNGDYYVESRNGKQESLDLEDTDFDEDEDEVSEELEKSVTAEDDFNHPELNLING